MGNDISAAHVRRVIADVGQCAESWIQRLVIGSDNAPLAYTGVTRPVADPAHVRAADRDHRVWLIGADYFIIPVKIIGEIRCAITLSAIQPNGKQLAVAGAELRELADKIIIISVCSVGWLMHIPGGEVNAEFHFIFAAAFRKLLHDIPLPILIGAGGNIMGGIVAWKQAKAIVVLGGENNPLAAGGLDSLHPLIRIDFLGVKLAG